MWSMGAPERRHGERLAVHGSALVHARPRALHTRIIDLARGGVRVSSAVPSGRDLVGRCLRIELRLDGGGARWLRMRGRVRRVALDGTEVSLALEDTPGELEDLLQDQFVAALECRRTLHALLIDELDERRELLELAFRRAGCHVTTARTPLEAVRVLDDAALHAGVIAFADGDHARGTAELCAYLDAAYPEIRRVAIDRDASFEQIARLVSEHQV